MNTINTYHHSFFDTSSIHRATRSAFDEKKSQDAEKIAQVAEDFEAFFISRTMESMFEGVSTDGMFGGGHAEKVYRSLLFNEYGKVMAKTGNIGVKDDIMRSILAMQEQNSQIAQAE